jgi:hypothetical protein
VACCAGLDPVGRGSRLGGTVQARPRKGNGGDKRPNRSLRVRDRSRGHLAQICVAMRHASAPHMSTLLLIVSQGCMVVAAVVLGGTVVLGAVVLGGTVVLGAVVLGGTVVLGTVVLGSTVVFAAVTVGGVVPPNVESAPVVVVVPPAVAPAPAGPGT